MIKPADWAEILKSAVASRAAPSHQYIAIQKEGRYQVLDSNAISSNVQKLSLKMIVEISKKQLSDLSKCYQENENFNFKEFSQITQCIAQNTDALIKGKEDKREKNKHLRTAVYVVAVVFSFFLVGIPFLVYLILQDRNFRLLNEGFKKYYSDILQKNEPISDYEVEEPEEIESDFSSEVKVVEEIRLIAESKITESINFLPYFKNAEDIKTQVVDRINSLLLLLEKTPEDVERECVLNAYLEDLPNDLDTKYVDQFTKDINRKITFQREDPYLKIKDAVPVPPQIEDIRVGENITDEVLKGYSDRAKHRIKQAAELINELITPQDDPKWRLLIQLFVNQTTLNALYHGMSHLLVMESMIDWSYEGNKYLLTFGINQPPIQLKIERKKEDGQIQAIHVKAEGNVDIVGQCQSKEIEDIVLIPQAIKSSINYEIAMNENNLPVIRNVHTSFQTTFNTQKKTIEGA